MERRVRVIAWPIILALAIFQTWAQRYHVGPDGISYLDLSDAVVSGHWSGLLNAYWSPLYPILIGVGRLIGGTGPEHELPIVHIVNLVAFIGMSVAFEYMLMSILELADRTRHAALRGPRGLAGVYGLYAVFAITMVPLELTTPDSLCATAVFLAFGALLRLRERPAIAPAIVLGAALGFGALAKSFMVPWAIVVLCVGAFALRRAGLRAIVVSVVVWAAVLLPWSIALSHAVGRFTFGDAGRLTYAWYVNEQNAPSLGGVPDGARTARTDAILLGSGVTGDAPGTDPMWFDPVRWNPATKPHWSLNDQLSTLATFVIFYIQNLTPLLFVATLIAVAPRGSRRESWANGWVVYVPAVAGVAAYAAVIVTARYIMPFVLAATLVILATLPVARRMLPLLVCAGLIAIVGIESLSSHTVLGLALVASVIGGVTVGVFVPMRRKALWVLGVLIGLFITRRILTPDARATLEGGSVALVLLITIAARAALRDWRGVQFARRVEWSLLVTLGLLLGLRLWLRVDQDQREFVVSNTWGDVWYKAAMDLASRGIGPGTPIAVIGPHADAYFARSGRLKVVANVPRPRVQDFWNLPPARRDSLLALFAEAGAKVAIAIDPPADGQPDSSWTAVPYRGWIRRLK